MILYHVSLERIREFVPKIPLVRGKGEDSQTPRICVARTIEGCINAMPGGCSSLLMLDRMGIPPVIYVYQFSIRKNAKGLYYPEDLREKVLDATLTHEHWLTETPKPPQELVCEVTQISTYEGMADPDGEFLFPVKDLDAHIIPEDSPGNIERILGKYPAMDSLLGDLTRKYGIRSVLQQLYNFEETKRLGKG